MNKWAVGTVFIAVFFIVLGSSWLLTIYQRGKTFLPKEKQPYFQKHNIFDIGSLRKEMKDVLSQESSRTFKMPKSYIAFFWAIVLLEVLCAFFYILSGITLVRMYGAGRLLAITTLFLDVALKLCVWTYHTYVATPLLHIHGKNILTSYFIVDEGWRASISGCLTGIKLTQPDFLLFAGIYSLYLFLAFYYFTRVEIIHAFKR